MNTGTPRILKSTTLVRAVFLIAVGLFFAADLHGQSLVISEIHYHPLAAAVPPGSVNIVDGDEFEFLEIRNDGASAFELNGCSLSGGITFTFIGSLILAPGESTVIVENPVYFGYRYPWVTRVAGQYGGKLSNGGESLVLRNSSGTPIFSVTYADEGGWPEGADGAGRSLMLSNPAGDPNDPANWCESAELHGSPTAAGTGNFRDVVVNEILAHSDPPFEDAIELYNTSGAAVDLNGWYLSDDLINPKKYQITNTVVGADGYTVFYEYQFNAGSNAFAFSSLGDELILTAPFPDENRLRLVDRLNFGATATDVSLGRFPNGSGGFTALKSPTFGITNPSTVEAFRTGEGAFNSTPKTGPVVINEIMYHTHREDTSYEYIELLNVSGETWDISGWVINGVNYTNPPGTFMAPGAFLVVCADHVALSNAYGIANVAGDWPGELQNGGERIELLTDEGAVIDSVLYNDKEPWPVGADGYGPSLERLRPAEDGDTYINWGASSMGTGWQHVVVTQSVTGAGTDALKFWLDHEGKCTIDDVSLQPLGGGSELITNGHFELGGAGWTPVGNHNSSRAEPGAGRSGSAGMVIVGNFTRILEENAEAFVYYGDALNNHVASDPYALATGNYVLSYWIRRGPQGMNLDYSVGGVAHTLGLGRYGTPGMSNSVATGLAPLGIEDVYAVSKVVAPADSNIIRARIEGAPAGASVKLCYRTVTTNTYQYTDVNYSELTMSDNGVSPDLTPGDGEYAATVPAVGAGRTIVRYHVEATATNGVVSRSPGVSNPSEDYGYWVQNDPVQTVIPNWQIISDGSPVVYSNSFRCCAVSPEGDVFTDVRVRHRGNPPSADEAKFMGLALRMNQGNPVDTFFAKNQEGINFRHRINDSTFWYCRVVNEYLAYHLQEQLGIVTAHHRHACLWMNGAPFITIELESPETGFLEQHALDNTDYVSRAGNAGRQFVDGDERLDNFDALMQLLGNVSDTAKNESIRTNLWYENIRYSLAQMSVISSVSQYFNGNMFQHRRASDRRWTQYPWDSDKTFVSEFNAQDMTALHPYYSTPDHPGVWDADASELLSNVLFYPENSIYTLPYRYRHQMTLWRLCHTLFTTNYIYSLLDGIKTELSPAYVQIGVDLKYLNASVDRAKVFTQNRRSFLMNGSWSDKDATIWGAGVYDPSTVVISEIMYDPGAGGEYLELYNKGSNTVDLSWWLMRVGDESYRLPHGTMLAPHSELAIVDTFSVLTNSYPELNSGNTIQRYPGMRIWDWPMVFLSANEYSTRVVDIPSLTLPNDGAAIEIYDICSNLVDAVTYSAVSPWPQTRGAALELVGADLDNALPSSWRRSFVGGTPAALNTADQDLDGDGLIDSWEIQINADIGQVAPDGDGDGDMLTNEGEFVLGTDPTVDDAGLALIAIWIENGEVVVGFNTLPVSGTGYDFYSSRLYTLEQSESLDPAAWSNVTGHVELPGTGDPVVYTNVVPAERMFYRYKVRLE